MPNEPSQQPTPFKFLPEYAECIAHGANLWANMDYMINTAIWALADVEPALGACITAQIYVTRGRLDALLALLKIRQADGAIIKKVNIFADGIREAQEIRNKIVHDGWLNSQHNPNVMGRLRVSAARVLDFKIHDISIDELRADVEKIKAKRAEFEQIRKLIWDALPSLPEISHEQLHPLVYTPHHS